MVIQTNPRGRKTAGVFLSNQSSRIVSPQPMIDKGHDQPHKERSEDVSYQLTQEASPPSMVEDDDMNGITYAYLMREGQNLAARVVVRRLVQWVFLVPIS